MSKNNHNKRSGPLVAATLLLGMGLGGFIDGIVFHQILQWHQMISNIVTPDTLLNKSVNMFWDGVFHAFTWTFTFTGLLILWSITSKPNVVKSDKIFAGGLLAGWGLFNLIDSANHFIFKIHNIREETANPFLYNILFLAFAIILLIVGGLLIVNERKKTTHIA
ncbi:DUF2243 domain-containing protein [Cytophagaceae bacterium ABcell3]|nr:DUF2243 domain-containing protein [Cytophagaceae bacterium ABcell3]